MVIIVGQHKTITNESIKGFGASVAINTPYFMVAADMVDIKVTNWLTEI